MATDVSQDKLRVEPAETGGAWQFRCPRCNATGNFSFRHRAGWCDGCSTTFVQASSGDGLHLASDDDAQRPRWIRVHSQPAEIF